MADYHGHYRYFVELLPLVTGSNQPKAVAQTAGKCELNSQNESESESESDFTGLGRFVMVARVSDTFLKVAVSDPVSAPKGAAPLSREPYCQLSLLNIIRTSPKNIKYKQQL